MLSRYFLSLALLAVLAGCSADPNRGLSPSPDTPSPTPAASTASGGPSGVGGKTRIRSKKGAPWVLDALKVVWNDPDHKARVEDVDWWLLDTSGQKRVRVQAQGAWFRVDEETMEFDGEVLATRPGTGDTLSVKHLIWDGKTRTFQGSGGVRWTRGPSQVTGDRMKASDALDKVELQGNVQGLTVFKVGSERQ